MTYGREDRQTMAQAGGDAYGSLSNAQREPYTIDFVVEGRSQKWVRFYESVADALRDARQVVEREHGEVGKIKVSTEAFPQGWLA